MSWMTLPTPWFLYCQILKASIWQWPPAPSHPHWRISTKSHCQANSHHLGGTLAQRDAWPSGSGWWLAWGANEMGRKTPSVVEGASLLGPSGIWPLWYSCPSVFLMAGHCLQANPGPSRGIWMVGGPSQPEHAMSLRLLAPSWFPWHEGPLCQQAQGNPSLGQSPSSVHGEVGDTSQGPVWGCMGL